ncbi:TPA: PAAR domain-containing protein [Pseudomonas putida]|nr:PAAR domain-containing protein [Pseudomonas putida]
MSRIKMNGRGQALEGDRTTTGATCLASIGSFRVGGRRVLREGDVTTPCPVCDKSGTIVEGMPGFVVAGRLAAMDGARVACDCPDGCRVIAPLGDPSPSRPTSVARSAEASPTPHEADSLPTRFRRNVASSPVDTLEPGFFIVPRCMTYQEVLVELGAPQANLPRSLSERLNPTHQQGFKAGEIFVIGDGLSRPVCTREELHAMSAAKQAREALASLTPEEAEFMVRHQAEIAGWLSEVSLSIGVSEAVMAKSLDDINLTLRKIEELHQQQFAKHGHLRSPEFFAERMKLLKQLNTNLKATVLNKRLNLGNYERLRRDLGISSKSLTHHWSKAGAPGQIPGYSTHLDKLASISKYLKAGGRIGIAIGGVGSAVKISDVCRAGDTRACEKVKVTEAGNFSGGLAGGWAGGLAATEVAAKVCWRIKHPAGNLICGLAITGAGAYIGSTGGMAGGEQMGELIFEALHDD